MKVCNEKFGLPYMGSKDKIVPSIASFLPSADNLYDLFGGGGSMTHFMMLKRSNKYKNFIYNDANPGSGVLLKRAINGEFNYNKFKPKFIGRDDFFKLKDTDPYVSVLWSFGNNFKSYIFGKDIEDYKESMHNAVVFGEFDETAKTYLEIDSWPNGFTSVHKRRLFMGQKLTHYKKGINPERNCLINKKHLQQLKQLQQLERLEQLQQLERLQQFTNGLEILAKSYEDVDIKPNSIIYCDPPYEGTAEYIVKFEKGKFLDWAANIKTPVYISEYQINDPRFQCVYDINKIILLSAQKTKRQYKSERLYWNGVSKS